MFLGEGGMITCGCYGNDPHIIPETTRKAYKLPTATIPRSPGHYQEWLDACKGGPPAGANFDFAGPLTEMVQLGNVAIRSTARLKQSGYDHRLDWDSENLRITNVPEANDLLRLEHRKF